MRCCESCAVLLERRVVMALSVLQATVQSVDFPHLVMCHACHPSNAIGPHHAVQRVKSNTHEHLFVLGCVCCGVLWGKA